MKMLKKAVLILAGLAFAMQAAAQAFPNRPVRLLVGYSAGGPTDVIARIVARLNQAIRASLVKAD
jgi:tripartite-type tricarboxylate transporter receptor subunit TctC